ncbi:DUF2383 domain-containing protein [Alkaliphilus peptidifermentans]|uniref:DUF2383 domain-containing protein n=1 Tax=Alkaliphilus peptidifermentans DSM 18978 TaxID=1120976 RepID=A0A1G5C225_9FIRM|nr:DUF2383 domain-containing protein [Alkaliphilus peptidifermentans]SCX96350.1 protein of unknown function [Alkaliphilus peptidifermentans DSM 18978]
MDEPNIKTLNELLKGEHMAIESYESVLPSLKDQQLREDINTILNDHKQHAMEISNRIIGLGGLPKEATGMVGIMSQTKLKAEGIFRNDRSIIKKLYDGEDQGIAMVEKIIQGDLDNSSMQMVQKILSTDHDHLKKLQEIIHSNDDH